MFLLSLETEKETQLIGDYIKSAGKKLKIQKRLSTVGEINICLTNIQDYQEISIGPREAMKSPRVSGFGHQHNKM